ncbi:MAG: tRNA1(Val) (adenine(37)-N6)-methyltransferase [Bacillota bacterium]|nr:tRNA1(Val) (adenine(37)-N6)-methyltransferase [Bacillota bacterium]
MVNTLEEIGFGGLKLVQSETGFRYGVDAVILADFACSLFPEFDKSVDLGTGTGIVPFILSHKNSTAQITGIDIQQDSVRIARRSCALNGLEERIAFFQEDVCRIDACCEGGSADMVTCNPPYVAKGKGLVNDSSAKYVARHETTGSLNDFVKAAAWLLKDRGHFFMVHRPSRLVDIFCSCRKHRLEPKHMRMVAPKQGEIPNIVLVHCVKNGGKELRLMKDLYIYEEDGSYSRQIEKIYERDKTDCGEKGEGAGTSVK